VVVVIITTLEVLEEDKNGTIPEITESMMKQLLFTVKGEGVVNIRQELEEEVQKNSMGDDMVRNMTIGMKQEEVEEAITPEVVVEVEVQVEVDPLRLILLLLLSMSQIILMSMVVRTMMHFLLTTIMRDQTRLIIHQETMSQLVEAVLLLLVEVVGIIPTCRDEREGAVPTIPTTITTTIIPILGEKMNITFHRHNNMRLRIIPSTGVNNILET
jgi:hypothetical protein